MTKKRCVLCLSNNIIKWRIRDSRQRYKCKRCNEFFVWKNKSKSLSKQRI